MAAWTVEQDRDRKLRRQMLLILIELRPSELKRVSGLSSVRVAQFIHTDKTVPREAALRIRSLVARRTAALFESGVRTKERK